MNSKTLTLLLAILAQGLLAPTGLVAEVLHVYPDGRGQYPTIQSAINEASPGDTVALADGTYRGDGNRDIEYHGKPITVASVSDEPSLCIIDCQGSESAPHRGFYFRGGESPTSVLRGITITAGYALDLAGC